MRFCDDCEEIPDNRQLNGLDRVSQKKRRSIERRFPF